MKNSGVAKKEDKNRQTIKIAVIVAETETNEKERHKNKNHNCAAWLICLIRP